MDTELTITHTHAEGTLIEGTLIEGTSRGDGTAEVLKGCGWWWGRSIGSWFVPHSRDRLPNTWTITRTRDALTAAGFTVTLQLDSTHRTTAEVEADKIARQQDRVDALEAKADRKSAAAEAAWTGQQRAFDRLPEGGEPIKIGHHSESRHRAAIKKAHTAMGRAVAAEDDAKTAQASATTAAATTGARYNPVTVANRIEKLGADIRRLDRQVTEQGWDREGNSVTPTAEQQEARRARRAPRRAELVDQLAYWEGVRADQIATGQATGHSRDTIHKGDIVRVRGYWRKVVRVNVKTVSVETGYSWTDTVPYAEIQAVRPAVEIAAADEAKAAAR